MDETEGNKAAVWGGKKEEISNDRIQSKLILITNRVTNRPDLVKYSLNGHLLHKNILVFHLELISPILSFPITAHAPIYHMIPWLWSWVVDMSGIVVI